MLMFAILGIVDSRSPGDFAGLVIGGVVVAIIMVVGPITGASLNPARAFGPELVSAIGDGATHWNQLIPVYVLPGLVGAGLAAFVYDFLAKPRGRRDADPGGGHPPRPGCDGSRPTVAAAKSGRIAPSWRSEHGTAPAPMKKFLNDPADVVRESLAGLAAAHGDILRYDAEAQIVVRADAPVAGQGRPRSPAAARATSRCTAASSGTGMLDAACPGEVFTSPVPDQMLAATKAVDGGAGVVHIVKNYTGDVMNFKLAAEDAADEGIGVESVLVDDDVAVQDSLYTAGRRGVGATVLVEKIAGAAAERGDDLAAVAGASRGG